MRNHPTTKRAFTLIELLTVIAIIGVLAALLFPAIKSALLKSETNKANAAISSSLAMAMRAYYTEYGKWPVVYPGTVVPPYPYEDFIVDEKIVALLSGDDVGGGGPKYPSTTGPHYVRVDTTFNPPYGVSPNQATIQGNPRRIVFLEFKSKEFDSSGYFVDPWSRPYHFRLDVNYQNEIDYPFTSPTAPLVPVNKRTLTGVGFLIWSPGPDGRYNQNDILTTASPLVLQSQDPINKDNVTSW